MIDIDSPPLQKKGIIFIPGEIEDNAYAQFRGGGGGGVQTRSVMEDVQEHIFPSTLLSTDEASEDRFKLL